MTRARFIITSLIAGLAGVLGMADSKPVASIAAEPKSVLVNCCLSSDLNPEQVTAMAERLTPRLRRYL